MISADLGSDVVTRVVFHTHLQGTRTLHAADPWHRRVEYIIRIADQGPSTLQGSQPPLDRSWNIEVEVLTIQNEMCCTNLSPLEVKSVTISQYCSMHTEPFSSHNGSRVVFVNVAPNKWQTTDFVQRHNDYINLCFELHSSNPPQEIEMFA